ncbi:ribonuclease h [Moniliophthora roreri]|nr:ribonuclease h [Moniliophthora roreri]
MHNGPASATDELDTLKTGLGMVDGWCETHPNTITYTYPQKPSYTTPKSQIDRIYVSHELFPAIYQWQIKTVGIRTDHQLVTVKVLDIDSPEIERGRWVWPMHINSDWELVDFIQSEGIKLIHDMERHQHMATWTDELNPQCLWEAFKTRILEKARERAKIIILKIKREINDITFKLEAISKGPTLDDEECALSKAVFYQKLVELETKQHNAAWLSSQAKNWLEGKAKRLLSALPDKWNLLTEELLEDYEACELCWQISSEDCHPFNPKITTQGTLVDAFRIFTAKVGIEDLPDTHIFPNLNYNHLTVYTDGSCTNNGLEDANAGAGIFVSPDSDYNREIKVPSELMPSNQVGEMLAIKEALEQILPYDLNIKTDSMYIVNGVTKHLQEWKDKGFIGVENAQLWQVLAARLHERNALTTLEWVKGHSGVPGNEAADWLANEGREKTQLDLIDMTIPQPLHLSGAKLSKITQANAYTAIKVAKSLSHRYQEARERPRTEQNIHKALESIKQAMGKNPSRKQLWKSLRNKTISRNI